MNKCKKCGKPIWEVPYTPPVTICTCKNQQDITFDMIERNIVDASHETLGYGELTKLLTTALFLLLKNRGLKGE